MVKQESKFWKILKLMCYSILINIGAIFAFLVLVLVIRAWSMAVELAQKLPDGLNIIAVIGLCCLLLVSLRLPNFISDNISLDFESESFKKAVLK